MPLSGSQRQARHKQTILRYLTEILANQQIINEKLDKLANDHGSNGSSLRKVSPIPPSKEEPSSLTSKTLIRSLDQEFEEIWPVFPRRVGKGAARRAYRTARKKAAFDVVLAGIQRLAIEHQTSEAKFIPHPATWLNQERWTDEQAKPNRSNGERYGRIRDPAEIMAEILAKDPNP